MRLTFGHEGDWIVDPREMTTRLEMPVQDLKRRGQVDVSLAIADGDDTGLSRVIVRRPVGDW
jgi:hypothetical protein